MSVVGICPRCGYEGVLQGAPAYVHADEKCPWCGECFDAGGESA